MSSLAEFQKTANRERELLKLMKKREQEKRKNLRKAATTLKKKARIAKKTARVLEREKTRRARKTQRDAARKTRKITRGKKTTEIKLNVSPSKTLEDYVKKTPYFKRPEPSARQRALELTVGQGIDVTPEMLKEIEEAQRLQQRIKSDEEELEELEQMVLADEAAEEYLDFMKKQPNQTLSDIEEDMMGGKRYKKSRTRHKRKKSRRKSRKSRRKSRKSRRKSQKSRKLNNRR